MNAMWSTTFGVGTDVFFLYFCAHGVEAPAKKTLSDVQFWAITTQRQSLRLSGGVFVAGDSHFQPEK